MELKLVCHLRYRTGEVWMDAAPEERFYLDDYEGNNEYTVHVRAVEVAVEVPDDFDPRPTQIKELERVRDELRAEFSKKVADIERRLS